MTNEEKANELIAGDESINISTVRLLIKDKVLEMAQWKDEQIAEENKWINVKDKLPRLVITEFGIRRSKPVLCKTKSGGYCVARCFQYKNQPHFWEDDYYEKPNVKFWKEIKG